MGSPLNRRFPRELAHNAGKYLGLFAMMLLAIAFTSGFLFAASSIEVILEGMRDAYNVEDGRFTADFEVERSVLVKVEELGCTVYDNRSYDLPLRCGQRDATARVHVNRSAVDLAAYAQGVEPHAENEVALDRVFAANNGVGVGDVVELDGRAFTVSGICTLSDYQALFEDNANFVFNALTFTVAQVTQEAFDNLEAKGAKYTYSFTLDDRAASDVQRTDFEERMVDLLGDEGVVLSDFVDSAANQGIGYALDDVTGDQAMWTALLFILIVIMGFVFVVLTSATIEAESAVIGTLLASGYRKRELLAHYLVLPALIGAVACVLGLVAGFTLLADPMKDLYYNSYSIPPYAGVLNPRVVVMTAVVPFVLLMGITCLGLARKLRCTPLQFLRRETAARSRRHSMRLPERLPFVTRFRMRVFLRNLSHFVTLFFGIAFANMLMLFGLCLMPVMEYFSQALEANMPAQHEYVLKAPLELEGSAAERDAYAAALRLAEGGGVAQEAMEDGFFSDVLLAAGIDDDAHPVNSQANSADAVDQAEKYAVTQLETERALFGLNEEVTVYGIQEGSRYWNDVDVGDGRMWTTQAVLDKTKVRLGEEALFVDRFGGKEHRLVMSGARPSECSMEVYMSLDDFRRVFDEDADYFNAYASDLPLALDDRYVASEMTPQDMRKIAEQMQDSMGNIVNMLMAIAVPVYLILVYLLTKTVIDRSSRAISYMKVFGYRTREVNRLYVRSITLTVLVSLVASLPLVYGFLAFVVKLVFMSYSGNFPLVISADRYAIIISAGAASYAVVALLHMRRIRKVPLAEALKVQE